MKSVVLWVVLLFSVRAALGDSLARGIVFHDLNGDLVPNKGEPGIAGVLVSNGMEVVETDAGGRYSLPVSDDTAIFVIKPKGWMIPVNDLHLPQYYYLHKPAGSPASKYAGVPPTGKLPPAINFPLHPQEETDQFTILVFGDPQPYNREQISFFTRDIIAELRDVEGVAFGMSLGDLVGDDLDLFTPLNESVAQVGIPWWNVYGNHDVNFDAKEDPLADETFEKHFGPATYAFQWGPVWFIVLDNVIYPHSPERSDMGNYMGGLNERDRLFLENLLTFIPRDALVVFSQHIPLFDEDYRSTPTYLTEDRKTLFALLQNHPHTLSFSAHTHYHKQVFMSAVEGWRQEKPHHHVNLGTTSGSWYCGPLDARGIPSSTMRDGTPNGYAFVDFDQNTYRLRWKSAGLPADKQMLVTAPKVMSATVRYTMDFYVNFFMGVPTDTVRYRINEGEWKNMRHSLEPDPAYVKEWLIQYDSETLVAPKSLPAPIDSSHLWKSRMPNDLPPGEYVLEIEATDQWGQTFSEKHSFRRE